VDLASIILFFFNKKSVNQIYFGQFLYAILYYLIERIKRAVSYLFLYCSTRG